MRHVRHPFPGSAHVHRRSEKLRHLASVRLTCMVTHNNNNIDVQINALYNTSRPSGPMCKP